MTTVGFGDKYPTTDGGKVFTIFYILGSLCFISTCAGEFFSKLADSRKTDKDDSTDSSSDQFCTSVFSRKNLTKFAAAFITILLFSLVGTLVIHFNEVVYPFTFIARRVITFSSSGVHTS
jgi:hypothetical protein